MPVKRFYSPLIAQTSVLNHPTGPTAYDCLRLIVMREGTAVVFSEFGWQPVSVGDVVLLGPNVLSCTEPEGHTAVTVIYVDTDYALDQFFWQHSPILHDRLDALGLAERVYSEPAQVLRIGRNRADMIAPWLDAMVAVSTEGKFRLKFNRLQALWFNVMDVLAPFIHVSSVRLTPLQRARARPVLPRSRRFVPLRREALLAREALHEDLAHTWTLHELAATVWLSPQQLVRVFTTAFGKTPKAYLTMLRVQEMARLLRETNIPVAEAGRRAGWRSRSRATEAFTEHTGVSPSRYRAMRPVGADRLP